MCISALLCALALEGLAQQKLNLEVTNPRNEARPPELASIAWPQVVSGLPGVQPGTVDLQDAEGNPVAFQVIDMHSDGNANDLIFPVQLKALESRIFVLRSKGQTAERESITDARFVLPRQDFAWENDRIAFRMYGPALSADVDNGIDVWTKRVRYRIVEKWYKANEGNTGKDSYHEDHGEGADFFSVGRSLGCGGSALWRDNALVQPGVFESYKIIATGPVRTTFELNYKPVRYGDRSITEVRRITLDAGQNLNKIEVTYEGESGPLEFAAGIVKRPNVTSARGGKENKWISLYGPVNGDAVNEFLGTAVIVPGSEFKEIREDSTHVLIIGSGSVGQRVTYYSGAGWTRSGDFKSREEWEGYLDSVAGNLEQPLNVRLKP